MTDEERAREIVQSAELRCAAACNGAKNDCAYCDQPALTKTIAAALREARGSCTCVGCPNHDREMHEAALRLAREEEREACYEAVKRAARVYRALAQSESQDIKDRVMADRYANILDGAAAKIRAMGDA